MAKEEKREEHKPKRKHLHEVRTQQAHDGTYVHHETYKKHRDDDKTEPERMNVATSRTPEEAGQHVADRFAMNEQPEEEPGGGGEPEGGAGGDPGAGGGGGGAAEPEEPGAADGEEM